MVLKVVNKVHNDKMGQMVLKGVILVHNGKIRSNSLERSELCMQYNKNHGFGSKTGVLKN